MRLLLAAALISFAGAAFVQAADSVPAEALRIVGSHAIVLDAPAGKATQYMAAGPLIGNGDIGVMQSGAADDLTFFVGKNDFWSLKHQAPIAVGRVRLGIPALAGAKLRTTTDMRLAEIRGEYAKDDASLTSRAWVDANRNIFLVELTNTGAKPLAIDIDTVKGAGSASASVPARVIGDEHTTKLGCEQYGGARWFFNGEMAGFRLLDRALSPKDIAAEAKSARSAVETFDGKTARTLTPPKISSALTVSVWVKPATLSKEADFIVSKGEWNQAYSLGLSTGRPQFTINGVALRADKPIPTGAWTHLASVYDGKSMTLSVNGEPVKTLGGPSPDAGDFLYTPDEPDASGRKVGFALRATNGLAGRTLTLAPGAKSVLATAILSDLDTAGKDPLAEAKALAATVTAETLASATAAHRRWWSDFWSRSFVEIPDKTIEQCWYSSWYIMGSCSRAGKIAPGLWGNWITVNNPMWHGDWHLNYNFQAPFFGLYTANHADTTLPYYEGMNQSIPRGQRIAAARGQKGIHLPVSIGPWGMCPEGDGSHWGQQSNTAYAALLYGWHWESTQDLAWLRTTGYPYMREVEKFWTHYLTFRDGRYFIDHDAIHEASGGAGRSGVSSDMNPILTLGLVRSLYRDMLDMSEALGVDADLRPKWRDILKKMSPFPTQQKGGKTVFRYTETGTAWWNDNTLGIQHIFPSGAIGLDSDPKLLEISRNMIDAMGRWRDYNGSSSWYTACARVGYDPKKILTELRRMYDGHTLPNKLLNFGGGGIENVSPSLAVTEMLLQSHEGVLRFFPSWPKDMDARFGTLRARGAFLVSAELKAGVVSGVTILSEKGRDCVVLNPWPGKKVKVFRNGTAAETVSGDRFTLKTKENETLALSPE